MSPFESSFAITVSGCEDQVERIRVAGKFQARREEVITSQHFFVRIPNQEFNFSSNPTFATAVGLVMNSMNRKKIDNKYDDENQGESSDEESVTNNENTDFSKTVFEKFTDKIKNFLENEE